MEGHTVKFVHIFNFIILNNCFTSFIFDLVGVGYGRSYCQICIDF